MKYFRNRGDETFIARLIDDVTAEYFDSQNNDWVRDDAMSIELEYGGDWEPLTAGLASSVILAKQTA